MSNARVIHYILTIRARVDEAGRHYAAGNPNSLHACTTSAQMAGEALAELLEDILIISPPLIHASGFRFSLMVLNRSLREMVAEMPDPTDEFTRAFEDAQTRGDMLLWMAETYDFIEFPKGVADDAAI